MNEKSLSELSIDELLSKLTKATDELIEMHKGLKDQTALMDKIKEVQMFQKLVEYKRQHLKS